MLDTVDTEARTEAAAMFVGGERIPGSAGTYPIINPATEEVVGYAPEASREDVDAAVLAAREAVAPWAATPRKERAALLERIAGGLRANSARLAPLISAEAGCLPAAASGMVARAADRFDRFAGALRSLRAVQLAPEVREAGADHELVYAEVDRRPHGVVAAICPFNFPLIGAASKIAPAIAMGNTVVFKPGPQDPLAVLALAGIFEDADVPAGVINLISGSGVDVGRALVESDGVDMVSFTGSTVAGIDIYRSGAQRMRRVLLELGGKGALIVRADADLDAVADTLARVWTYYSGQWCAAPTRAIVHRSVYDEVISRLVSIGAALQPGDPADPAASMGPLISAVQRDRVASMVARALDEGARDLLADTGRRLPGTGHFVSPALLVDCRPSMEIIQNEVFGPVLTVQAFDDDEEAIALANGTQYGLTNYLYSRDLARAKEIAGRLRSGSVLVNVATPHEDLPFGGFGMSGVGRDNGVFALEAYSEPQGIALGV